MSQKRNKKDKQRQIEQSNVQADRKVTEMKTDNDAEAQLLQELEDIGKEQLQDISSRVRALIGSDKEAVRNFNSQRRKEQEEKQKEEREAKQQEEKQKEAKKQEQKDSSGASKNNDKRTNNRKAGKDRGKNKNTQSGVRDLAFQDFDIRNSEEADHENNKKKTGVEKAESAAQKREKTSDIDKEIDEEIELQIQAEELRKQRLLDQPDERDDFLGNLARKEVPKSQQKIRKKTPDRLKRDIPVQEDGGFLERIRTLALKGPLNAAAIVSVVALFVILSIALILDRNNTGTDEHTVFKTTGVTKAEKLIENYYAALESKDVENVREYLYEGDKISDEDITARIHQNSYFVENGIVEDHKVVKGYLVDGLRDKEYVLFLKYSLKIFNINTEAVGIQTYYIIDVSEEGKAIDYRICASLEEGSEYFEYVSKVSDSKEVKKLLKEVNDELSEACENDKELNNLVNVLLTGGGTIKDEDEPQTEESTSN